MLYITAIIKARPDAVEALTELFKPLVVSTRQEIGCHRYDLHRTLTDLTTFIMQEEWESEVSIQAHNNSDHFQKFVAGATPLLDGPLQIYTTEQIL
jgi:quinol monooxygenase YgiN